MLLHNSLEVRKECMKYVRETTTKSVLSVAMKHHSDYDKLASFLNPKYEMLLKILQITTRVAAILDLFKLTIVPGLFICHKAHFSEQNKTGIITIAIFGASFHNLTGLISK